MLDAPVQLVGNLAGPLFVGRWRIGDSMAWQKFEFSTASSATSHSSSSNNNTLSLFRGFFELVKNKNSRIKVEETFSFLQCEGKPECKQEVLSGQGTNKFGDFSISGTHNLITNEFTGEKRYTTWAGDNKPSAAAASAIKKRPVKRRKKKRVEDEDEDEEDGGEGDQIEVAIATQSLLVQPLPAPPPPPPPPPPPRQEEETNQSKARKRILQFVLQLPNRHVYPYDPLDLGSDLARRRYLQSQIQVRSATALPSRARVNSHHHLRLASPPFASSSSLSAAAAALPIVLLTNEPPALDLFRHPNTSMLTKQSHHSANSTSSLSSSHAATAAAQHAPEESVRAEAKFESDGTVFEGHTLNGLRHGWGVCGYWNGHLYVGNFRRGQEHGHGELRDATGAMIYRGMFEHGKISGFGTMYYSDGAVFQGEFRESNRHGKGIIWYSDGSYYDGDFSHGARSGFGKFVDVKSNAHYFGEWNHDVRHGTGRLDLADGSFIDGSFKDNLPDGRCFCQYPNGDLFEGNFKEGQREGRGTYTFATKAKLEGRFTRDEAIGKSGTLELEENSAIELPHASNPRLSEWLTPIKDPNESHITAGFYKDGT
ncbi:hypothetical protein BASA81_002452 [Batrachochytrium salamandrivorans]|nr:hypothetical protein BASA81_002452 [Batrachochytrium salamandrivorans]